MLLASRRLTQLYQKAIKMKRNLRSAQRRNERDAVLAAIAEGEAPAAVSAEEVMRRYVDRVHPPI